MRLQRSMAPARIGRAAGNEELAYCARSARRGASGDPNTNSTASIGGLAESALHKSRTVSHGGVTSGRGALDDETSIRLTATTSKRRCEPSTVKKLPRLPK